jgi:nitroreductase
MLGALEDEPAGYAPIRFELAQDGGRAELEGLLVGAREQPLTKRDGLFAQVRELLKTRDPGEFSSRQALDEAAAAFLRERGPETYGTWVYYPWRRVLVRVLPAAEFVELRTSRNRYKITAEEQEILGRATIGIIGLSAGHAIAVGLALERVGSRFRLADFDTMELSNMNRVACAVEALGVNKAVLTARQLYEIDPYLDISVFTEGVTPDNIDAFMTGGAKLDLLIEECDDLYMKVRLREEAKASCIPVVMETNDRGLLDIERFDLEPERPVFHGLLEGVRSDELRGLDTEGKTPFMLRILGDRMSPRLAASLIEIDKTISGWPQLASGNLLGGAVVTDVSRRLLLGQRAHSGRYTVDLEELVGASSVLPEPVSPPEPIAANVASPVVTKDQLISRGEIPARAEIEWLVGRAALAPSGGNDQPWRFVWRGGRELDCYLDRERSGSFLDYERSASYLALGAAAESASIASSALKRPARLVVFPTPTDPDLVFRLTLGEPSKAVDEHPLVPYLEQRVTNRRLGPRKPLDPVHASTLCDAARERGTELTLITDPGTLSEVGAVLGQVDRFRFLCERLHTSMMGELRFTPEQALATGDGIDVATLELDAVGMAGLKLLSNPTTSGFLRSLGKGVRLENSARRAIASASAVGALSIAGYDARTHVQAGRAMQRIWLLATRLGLAFQPMAVAPYLFARLNLGRGEGFSKTEIAHLRAIHERYARLFPSAPGRSQPMLFRLAHSPQPTARSLRRPIEAIFKEI